MVKYERRLFDRNIDNSTIPEMKIISIPIKNSQGISRSRFYLDWKK